MSIQGNWDERRLVSRRAFLGLSGMGAAALMLGAGALSSSRVLAEPFFADDPFKLGVASGDPLPGGVVLWTRLAPEPLAEDGSGGLPPEAYGVRYEVAEDESFRRIVKRGAVEAVPELGHSVHAEVSGLQAGREYYYRFKAGTAISPVGRTKTAPAYGSSPAEFAFAFTSCQSYANGCYTAHARMAEEDLDLVVQLGDYIYEGAPTASSIGRQHEGDGEPITLAEYRNRHAQYKTDADLQAAHAAFAWVTVLDDHEIDNNWADEVPQDPQRQSREAFLARREAAFQAYYENMPLRRTSLPQGIDIQLYRRLTFGDLMDFHVLDTRQYRSDQSQAQRTDPNRTILGDEQEAWLRSAVAGDTARWNVLAQQVFFSQRDFTSGPNDSFSDDAWDNYVVERDSLRDHLTTVGTSNPVVLTGDVHANYVSDVKANFDDPDSATVATELVGTSISTGGDGLDQNPSDAVQLAENPHIKFINRNRGYVRNVVTPNDWTADFRVVDVVTTPGAPVRTRATFVIEEGTPGATQA